MFNHSVTNEKILKVQADKRRAERVSSAFSGAVSVDGEFLCHCVIKDVSNTGMRLHAPKNTKFPEEFEIKTPAIPNKLCVKLQWQAGQYFGVIFTKLEMLEDETEELQKAG